MDEVAVGNINIKATRTRDKNGREGFFLTKKDWGTVRSVIAHQGKDISSKRKKKESLMPGIREAFKEIRADILGSKTLPDAQRDL